MYDNVNESKNNKKCVSEKNINLEEQIKDNR